MSSLTPNSLTTRSVAAACVLCLTVVSIGSSQDTSVDELVSRAYAMIQKAQQLAEDGRVNEADELEQKARKLIESTKHSPEWWSRHLIESAKKKEERNRQGKSERGEVDSKQKEKGRKEGDEDRRTAGKDAQSKKTTERKLDPREHKPGHPGHPEFEKAAQRLQHIRIAAENLKAAGMPDLAQATAQRAEEMEHQLKEAHAQHEREAKGGSRDRRDEVIESLRQLREAHAHHEREAKGGGRDDRAEAIENLRREVQQLREELKAIHAKLAK